MDAEVIPPSDWIDFYPPSADRLAALSVLKREQVTRAQHVAMGFPYVIGHASAKGAAALTPDPALYFMYKKWVVDIDPRNVSFSQLAKQLVSGELYSSDRFANWEYRKPSKAEKEKVAEQVDIVQSLLRITIPKFGTRHRLRADFDFENGLIVPHDLKAPNWHPDYKDGPLQILTSTESLPAPGLDIQVRTYGPAEFMKNQWVREEGKLVLHPAAAAILEAQDVLNTAGKRVAPYVKAELQAITNERTEEARQQGLITQPQPYDFMASTTLDAHRSMVPATPVFIPTPSGFARLIVNKYFGPG